MSTCIAVVGPPRTGTSAVAGLLHALGIPTGVSAVAPNLYNPKGFFEDADFWHLNAAACGSAEVPSLTSVWTPERLADLRRVVQVRSARHPIWAVKDPRLCMTLPTLLQVCQDVGTPLKVIFTSRNSWQAVSSLATLWGRIGLDRAAELWGRYSVAVAKSRREFIGLKMLVDFNDTIEVPAVVVDGVADFVERPVTAAARAWIDPGLRHF